MPFLKVLPEKEEEQVKFIEVSPVYEPEKQEESNEAIIDAAQETTPPEESESEQDDTPAPVDDINVIDEPANEPTQESPVTEPVTQEPTQENTPESEPIPEPLDEQTEQEEASPLESTPPEHTNESESTQNNPPTPVDDIDVIDETATEPTTPEESLQPAQDDTHAPVDEPITPPNESKESESMQDPPPAPIDETAAEPTQPEESPKPENISLVETITPEPKPTTPEEPNEPPESTPIDTGNKYTGGDIKYDVTSGKRYVDLVSTKTDFDRMLDELAAISKDIIEHEAERFAKKYTGKFQGGFDKAEADAKKYDAFLGGYITNAAMLLYDRGHREVAISKLEETRKVLEARKRLEDETAAIKTRVEEEDAVVDLSDILGLFGDG